MRGRATVFLRVGALLGGFALIAGACSSSPEEATTISDTTAASSTTTRTTTTTQDGTTSFTAHAGSMVQLRFSPDGGSLVTVGQREGTCSGLPPGHCVVTKVWDARTLELRHTFEVAPFDVAFSPDGALLLTTGGNGEATSWDLADGSSLITFPGNPGYLGAVSGSFNSDGSRVVTARGDDAARVWDVASGRLLLTLAVEGSTVQFATFSPDGALVLSTRWTEGSRGGVADLWDATTGAHVGSFTVNSAHIAPVAFSPGGERVAMGSFDGIGRIWDVATGGLVTTLPAVEGASYVDPTAFSPDGTRLVKLDLGEAIVGAGGRSELWDATTGRLVATLDSGVYLIDAEFSSDGTRVLTAAEDLVGDVGFRGRVTLWDASTGAEQVVITDRAAPVSAAAFSPDGRRLATAWDDGTVTIRELPAARACASMPVYDARGPQGVVYRLYRAYLGREPERPGYEHWVAAHAAGLPLAAIAEEFFRSAEFDVRGYSRGPAEDFLRFAYRSVLHRTADEAGVAYWLDQMARGVSAGMVMLQFSESSEFRTRTDTGMPPGHTPLISRFEGVGTARAPVCLLGPSVSRTALSGPPEGWGLTGNSFQLLDADGRRIGALDEAAEGRVPGWDQVREIVVDVDARVHWSVELLPISLAQWIDITSASGTAGGIKAVTVPKDQPVDVTCSCFFVEVYALDSAGQRGPLLFTAWGEDGAHEGQMVVPAATAYLELFFSGVDQWAFQRA